MGFSKDELHFLKMCVINAYHKKCEKLDTLKIQKNLQSDDGRIAFFDRQETKLNKEIDFIESLIRKLYFGGEI